ncbi:spheroidene monooxygenase [Histidinibacterium aquaticum]|uniref:Spheroidene monooxygenase n=1 Tax=Histidinibacterium aquaticum TaxID=2613962 RepID=A0A5J5GFE8_9RHOB|nr:spheroidene monooxygenase [Histidinibacterium aquaticum]KAA9006841.1 spheroidene monooxygenase [Histidinibacterium aquaticum]
MGDCATLSLFRFDRRRDRAWAFAQMGLARGELRRTPGLGFWKLVGSGTGEGFTPKPNTAVWGILATWPDEGTARRQTASAPVFRRFARRASESWTTFLAPLSTRGQWSGESPFEARERPGSGPLAVLTRAKIRPGIAPKFWSRAPAISRAIGANSDVLFKIGVGEVPWLQQVTFSIWPDADSMARFARRGHHAEAIRAVRAEGWFREELYARFRVLGDAGTWGGQSPLDRTKEAA